MPSIRIAGSPSTSTATASLTAFTTLDLADREALDRAFEPRLDRALEPLRFVDIFLFPYFYQLRQEMKKMHVQTDKDGNEFGRRWEIKNGQSDEDGERVWRGVR